jgi:hypothetical protein
VAESGALGDVRSDMHPRLVVYGEFGEDPDAADQDWSGPEPVLILGQGESRLRLG